MENIYFFDPTLQWDFYQAILNYEMIKLHNKDFIQDILFHYIVLL